MVSISNADRDKAVEFIRAYVYMLLERGMCTAKQVNARRMALNLANKLERKPTFPAVAMPDKVDPQPRKQPLKQQTNRLRNNPNDK